MALIDNIISYWKLDEESGTRVDAHGSNNLTDNNTVLYDTGKIGNAADFTASNDESLSITDGSQTGLEPAQFSISFWFYANATGGSRGLVGKNHSTSWNSPYSSYQIYLDGTTIRLNTGSSGSQETIAADTTAEVDTWYHIVGTYDGSHIRIYVNGNEDATPVAETAIDYSNGAFQIGSRAFVANNQFFDGLIDEVAFYSRAISLSEVGELYNSGDGFQYPFEPPATVKSIKGVLIADIKSINGLE